MQGSVWRRRSFHRSSRDGPCGVRGSARAGRFRSFQNSSRKKRRTVCAQIEFDGGCVAGRVCWPARLSAAAQGSLAIVFDVGGRGDLSFNDMGALGGDRAQRELGVTVREVESATTADFLPNLRALARTRQYDVIAGIGFLLEDAMAQVARGVPEPEVCHDGRFR